MTAGNVEVLIGEIRYKPADRTASGRTAKRDHRAPGTRHKPSPPPRRLDAQIPLPEGKAAP